jgi:alpha-glucosidase
LGDELFRAEVVRADVLRLAVSRGRVFEPRPTFATAFELPPVVRFEFEERPDELLLRTDELTLTLDRRDFFLDVVRADGSLVLRSARDADGASLAYRALNDSFAVARSAGEDDLVLGLGQKTGSFNRRGKSFTLFNVDVLSPGVLAHSRLLQGAAGPDPEGTSFDPYYTSIPFFIHARLCDGLLAAAGTFIDNGGLGRFDFEASDLIAYEFTRDSYVEYVIAGPTLGRVLEAYTFLTGRPELPPLWSLGHQQCRWHDYTDRELLELGREYRARGIPCDALWLDIGHLDGYRVFSFHPERFPRPERTFATLAAEGFRCVTIVDPGVKREPGNALFDAGVRDGHFCKTEAGALYEGRVWPGRTVFPDFSRGATRKFWSGLVRQHAERGVAGIWNDMNEPATGPIEPFGMRFDRDGENHPHERFHNQYALLMALATHAGLTAARPLERPFVLSRAGSAGIQRVAAQWLGDHSATWEHLRMGLPMALGLGLSGQPFVGGDVPGFAGVATPELAARWFEYAALTPFCRCHHQLDLPDHYPWSFGPEVERVARAALELRYRLLPYLYAAFLEASRSGAPVQRPLAFDFPDDVRALEVEDQYLLGESLLVAPVLQPGREARYVYLPRGSWLDWHAGTIHRGERLIEVHAPLGRVPLFSRGGAVLPLWESAPPTTHGFFPERIELKVCVPMEDGVRTSVLYEDDGTTTAYRAGASYYTRIECERRRGELRIHATTAGAGFAECRRSALRLRFAGETPSGVLLNGAPVTLDEGVLDFPYRNEGFELAARLG